MKIEQTKWTPVQRWSPEAPNNLADAAQLVLLFGATSLLKEQKNFDDIRGAYPNAHFLGCSTSGEIRVTSTF